MGSSLFKAHQNVPGSEMAAEYVLSVLLAVLKGLQTENYTGARVNAN